MNKFIKLNYFPATVVGNSVVLYKGNDGKPMSVIISLDSIKSISGAPDTFKLFEKFDDCCSTYSVANAKSDLVEVYSVRTDIAYGRGHNGVDFYMFRVTKETYGRLVSAIEFL